MGRSFENNFNFHEGKSTTKLTFMEPQKTPLTIFLTEPTKTLRDNLASIKFKNKTTKNSFSTHSLRETYKISSPCALSCHTISEASE